MERCRNDSFAYWLNKKFRSDLFIDLTKTNSSTDICIWRYYGNRRFSGKLR